MDDFDDLILRLLDFGDVEMEVMMDAIIRRPIYFLVVKGATIVRTSSTDIRVAAKLAVRKCEADAHLPVVAHHVQSGF